jgi:hypothetical protein
VPFDPAAVAVGDNPGTQVGPEAVLDVRAGGADPDAAIVGAAEDHEVSFGEEFTGDEPAVAGVDAGAEVPERGVGRKRAGQ